MISAGIGFEEAKKKCQGFVQCETDFDLYHDKISNGCYEMARVLPVRRDKKPVAYAKCGETHQDNIPDIRYDEDDAFKMSGSSKDMIECIINLAHDRPQSCWSGAKNFVAPGAMPHPQSETTEARSAKLPALKPPASKVELSAPKPSEGVSVEEKKLKENTQKSHLHEIIRRVREGCKGTQECEEIIDRLFDTGGNGAFEEACDAERENMEDSSYGRIDRAEIRRAANDCVVKYVKVVHERDAFVEKVLKVTGIKSESYDGVYKAFKKFADYWALNDVLLDVTMKEDKAECRKLKDPQKCEEAFEKIFSTESGAIEAACLKTTETLDCHEKYTRGIQKRDNFIDDALAAAKIEKETYDCVHDIASRRPQTCWETSHSPDNEVVNRLRLLAGASYLVVADNYDVAKFTPLAVRIPIWKSLFVQPQGFFLYAPWAMGTGAAKGDIDAATGEPTISRSANDGGGGLGIGLQAGMFIFESKDAAISLGAEYTYGSVGGPSDDSGSSKSKTLQTMSGILEYQIAPSGFGYKKIFLGLYVGGGALYSHGFKGMLESGIKLYIL